MTIPAVRYPIEISSPPPIWRGDPYTLKITMPGVSDLTPYGDTWTSQLRVARASDPAVDWTVDDSHLTSGYVKLSLDGDATADLTASAYGFDVQATGGSVDPFTVWVCRSIKVDGDYTRG